MCSERRCLESRNMRGARREAWSGISVRMSDGG